jgi:hypothetical protein
LFINEDKIGRACCSYEKGEKCRHEFSGKTWGMKPRGIPKLICENNTKIYLRKIGEEGGKLLHLVQISSKQRTVTNIVKSIRVP